MSAFDRVVVIVLQFLLDFGRQLAARAALKRAAGDAASQASQGNTGPAEELIRKHGGKK